MNGTRDTFAVQYDVLVLLYALVIMYSVYAVIKSLLPSAIGNSVPTKKRRGVGVRGCALRPVAK